MKPNPLAETSKVWRIPHFSDLELLHGTRLTHAFPRHTHERYAIGVIEQGALGYWYRGEHVVALPGQINLCVPGEAHTGQPVTGEGWSYRMFYFETAMLEQVASEIADRPQGLPFFRAGVLIDPLIAGQLRQVHRTLETRAATLLEQETDLRDMVAQLIMRHAEDRPLVARLGREPTAVQRLKEYIESHYADDLTLDQLLQLTNLSRFHLVRVFQATVGVPPHAYLRQVRIRHAKALLATGVSIAEVALATGFSDQSHLNRWFKRLCGFTPGQYRNSIQDNRAPLR
jgi:AraC-like DNA-binding protein